MNNKILKQFQEHIIHLRTETAKVLVAAKLDTLVIHAGVAQRFFADDQEMAFRPTPHFSHWCPLRSAGHILLICGDARPRLYLHNKPSYWVDNEIKLDTGWLDSFDIASIDDAEPALRALKNGAWIGPDLSWRPPHIDFNPVALQQELDANRACKTPYEISCIAAANRVAMRGHARLQECFAAGASELELHHAYLQATQQQECDLPYPSIIALGHKAAVLHYQHKRKEIRNAPVLLADCGATVRGYAADVTRTWTRQHAHPLFIELLREIERIQQELCAAVKSGVSFYDLNYQAHERIAALLIATKLLVDVSRDEAIAAGLSKIFFPHGLGHLLGIQVHDVGGERLPCPYEKPLLQVFANLRFKGKLKVDEVVTIEPGIYFIPMLLDQQRANPKLNHNLIEALLPCGGIRIEDDILVRSNDAVNLTRKGGDDESQIA